jgi:hypothetical protein
MSPGSGEGDIFLLNGRATRPDATFVLDKTLSRD